MTMTTNEFISAVLNSKVIDHFIDTYFYKGYTIRSVLFKNKKIFLWHGERLNNYRSIDWIIVEDHINNKVKIHKHYLKRRSVHESI